ncbi:hypothetical protein Tco_1069476 [Tanacetum coccineum]|uniref:DUF4806 domain-containing protein n=1 Tax=Tanacetum coccineum TaxID=301880 RepID=A0ABQ5HIY5_9ASTR
MQHENQSCKDSKGTHVSSCLGSSSSHYLLSSFPDHIDKKDSTSYQFKIDKKRYIIDMEVFIEILLICPRLPNQEFDALPSNEEIVSFIKELGHKGDIKSITEVVVDQMYQPWRTFAGIINKCLSGKITDFTFQIENRDTKKQEKMYYPIFTKAIIHHFITKDKSISMRNKMFMHLPMMTAFWMWNSPSYKNYLAYATRAANPKKSRKFKKPASPSKKGTLIIVEEEEPESVKKVVPDKPKGKSVDTHEGIGLKQGVFDVSKAYSSESEYESWGDSGDEANVQGDDEDFQDSDDDPQQANDKRTGFENQETNDDEDESDNEFVHTPEDYVPTDDETNDETKDVDEEDYERISEELYSDVNVKLIDAEHNDEEKGDAYMTDVAHYIEQETTTMTPALHNATTEVPPLIPRTSPLLTILVSVIPEHNVFNPSETVITPLTTTINSLLLSLFPSLQQSIPILTPTNTEATTSTFAVPESETLSALHQRITDLEKDVKELQNVDNSTTVILTIKSKVPNAVKEYLGSSLDDALYKMIQKYSADIIQEHSVPAKIVKRLKQ